MEALAVSVAGAVASLIGSPVAKKIQEQFEDKAIQLGKIALLAEEVTPQLSSQALNDLNKMKKESGRGVSTMISIANSTGADMRIVNIYDYHGHVGKYPPPPNIGPGQVGVFLHTKTAGAMYGTKAAIIYRVIDLDKKEKDVLMAFDAGFRRTKDRKVYVAITEKQEWPTKGEVFWKDVQKAIDNNSTKNISKAGALAIIPSKTEETNQKGSKPTGETGTTNQKGSKPTGKTGATNKEGAKPTGETGTTD